jgi:asparagine synthase (glutamine-hydrolysing)
MPTSFKLNGGVGKHIFKQVAARYVPAPLISRRKMGFSVPLALWFRTSLRSSFVSLALRHRMEQYVSLTEVQRLWNEHQCGWHNHDRKLWNIFMLACWDAHHNAKKELNLAEAATAQI